MAQFYLFSCQSILAKENEPIQIWNNQETEEDKRNTTANRTTYNFIKEMKQVQCFFFRINFPKSSFVFFLVRFACTCAINLSEILRIYGSNVELRTFIFTHPIY